MQELSSLRCHTAPRRTSGIWYGQLFFASGCPTAVLLVCGRYIEPVRVPVRVLAVALEFSQALYQCLAVGGPLGRLLGTWFCVALASGHALIHNPGDDCWICGNYCPRMNVVDPCAAWLFTEEESA